MFAPTIILSVFREWDLQNPALVSHIPFRGVDDAQMRCAEYDAQGFVAVWHLTDAHMALRQQIGLPAKPVEVTA